MSHYICRLCKVAGTMSIVQLQVKAHCNQSIDFLFTKTRLMFLTNLRFIVYASFAAKNHMITGIETQFLR